MCTGAGNITEHLISAANTTLLSMLVTNFTIYLILTAERHCFSNKYRCFKLHCFAVLVAVSLISALFWDFSQYRVIIRTKFRYNLQVPSSRFKQTNWTAQTAWPLEMGPGRFSLYIGTNWHSILRRNLWEVESHLHAAEAWNQEDLFFLDYLTVRHGTYRVSRYVG